MKLDIFTIHTDDLGDKIGVFFDTTIRLWDSMVSRLRAVRDTLFIVLSAQEQPVVVAPEVATLIDTGQYEICTDHMLRRGSAAKRLFKAAMDVPKGSLALDQHTSGIAATAHSFTETPENSRRLTIEEAVARIKEGAQILWRPNNENYALEIL